MIDREKKALRRTMKTTLAAMGEDDRRARSAAIHSGLTGLDVYAEAQTILAYASFGSEVQTEKLLERILKDKKTLVLPRLKPAGHSLALHEVRNLDTDLVRSTFGILEPRATLAGVHLQDIPLILVPGLAFDHYGNRLGRGLGCYDRLLANATPDNTTVALAFEAQLVGGMDIPEGEYDVPMDMIVTESRIIDRRDVFELLKRREQAKSVT
jgi:5-formyltetrahydrofolate cyclo-ligase